MLFRGWQGWNRDVWPLENVGKQVPKASYLGISSWFPHPITGAISSHSQVFRNLNARQLPDCILSFEMALEGIASQEAAATSFSP